MNQALIDIAVERGRLLERISNQRQLIGRELQPVGTALLTADRALINVRKGSSYVREHPEMVAVGVAVLVIAKPRFVWRWTKRAYFAWRTWRTLRGQITDLGVVAARRP